MGKYTFQRRDIAIKRVINIFLLLSLSGNLAALTVYEGGWTKNDVETKALKEPYKDKSRKKSSRFRMSSSVSGLPLPGSRSQRAMSQLTAQSPMVLRSTEMVIKITDDQVLIEYLGLGQEILYKGDYRGRKSKWSRKKITQSYKTTERKVSKNWSVREDGRLIVTVKITPNQSKQTVNHIVFDKQLRN